MQNYSFRNADQVNTSTWINEHILEQDKFVKREFLFRHGCGKWFIHHSKVVEGTYRFEFSAPAADLDILLTDPTWSKICAIYSSLKAMSNDPNDFEEPEGLAVADNGVLEVITGS